MSIASEVDCEWFWRCLGELLETKNRSENDMEDKIDFLFGSKIYKNRSRLWGQFLNSLKMGFQSLTNHFMLTQNPPPLSHFEVCRVGAFLLGPAFFTRRDFLRRAGPRPFFGGPRAPGPALGGPSGVPNPPCY